MTDLVVRKIGISCDWCVMPGVSCSSVNKKVSKWQRGTTIAAPDRPNPRLLAAFAVRQPVLVARTAIATVWKVQKADGTALKIYPPKGMGSEAPGFELLSALDGRAAARVFLRNHTAALIEWLDGPSLGDLTRAGQDTEANRLLVDVALRLHATDLGTDLTLPELPDWFRALFDLHFGPACPPQAVANLTRCKQMATALLGDPRDVRPLHGDLHHDNIRLGQRGYCAFDAKGVVGERTYELANAFRNPKGAAAIVQDPTRIRHLATSWASAFGVDQHRLLTWAAVKSALSIAWRCGTAFETDDELALLAQFLLVLDDTPKPTKLLS